MLRTIHICIGGKNIENGLIYINWINLFRFVGESEGHNVWKYIGTLNIELKSKPNISAIDNDEMLIQTTMDKF